MPFVHPARGHGAVPQAPSLAMSVPRGVRLMHLALGLLLAFVAGGCSPDGPPGAGSDQAEPSAAPVMVTSAAGARDGAPLGGPESGDEGGQTEPDDESASADRAAGSAAEGVAPAQGAERDPAAAHAPSEVRVELSTVARGFERPIAAAALGDGSGRLLVAEKAGRLWLISTDARDGEADAGEPTLFVDLRDRVNDGASEQGLLGVAPHPDFEANGRLFLSYSDRDDATIVVELAADEARGSADPGSERLLLRVDQPARNHNGGHLAFGPDGHLWIGTGDGGRAGDPWNNAQDPSVLLGKMLRLDVDAASQGASPYAIPADNPFVGQAGVRPEIWAIGLRNPWRYHFDRLTGDLFVGDVGQNVWEEINFEPAGAEGGRNYGWRLLEADACYEPERDCDPEARTTRPILAYSHAGGVGCSVTGGTVYRGFAQPTLWGLYLYADYCSGRIWAASTGAATGGMGAAEQGWSTALVANTGRAIAAFVEDAQGELYVLDDAGGELLRVEGRLR